MVVHRNQVSHSKWVRQSRQPLGQSLSRQVWEWSSLPFSSQTQLPVSWCSDCLTAADLFLPVNPPNALTSQVTALWLLHPSRSRWMLTSHTIFSSHVSYEAQKQPGKSLLILSPPLTLDVFKQLKAKHVPRVKPFTFKQDFILDWIQKIVSDVTYCPF